MTPVPTPPPAARPAAQGAPLEAVVLEADGLDPNGHRALAEAIHGEGLVDGRPPVLDSPWRHAGLLQAVDRSP